MWHDFCEEPAATTFGSSRQQEDRRSVVAYFMDSPTEADRLASKVDAPAFVSRYLTPHLAAARSFLDVGCGAGTILAEAKRQHPHLRVAGVDSSPARVERARHELQAVGAGEVLEGDASALPLDAAQFDVVLCRFLLEYLADPLGAIHEMTRVARPGGTVVLQDLDGQLVWHFPIEPELEAGLHVVLDALASGGFDPFVGRKLFHLARRARLDVTSVAVEPYHTVFGRVASADRELWVAKLDNALPACAQALGSRSAAEALIERFLRHLDDEETLSYSVSFTVVARVP